VLRGRLRPPHLHDLRAGRPRQHVRRLRSRLHHEPDHLGGRGAHLYRDGLRGRLRDLHRPDVRPPRRHLRQAHMSWRRFWAVLIIAVLAVEPFLPLGRMREYLVHVMVQIFIWSFVGGAWSLMGRFGLGSLGHGAFLGVGAYATCLLWNFFGLTPWIGGLVAVLLTVVLAVVVGYPWSPFPVVRPYFGAVTPPRSGGGRPPLIPGGGRAGRPPCAPPKTPP